MSKYLHKSPLSVHLDLSPGNHLIWCNATCTWYDFVSTRSPLVQPVTDPPVSQQTSHVLYSLRVHTLNLCLLYIVSFKNTNTDSHAVTAILMMMFRGSPFAAVY